MAQRPQQPEVYDHYDTLGLDDTASDKQIIRAITLSREKVEKAEETLTDKTAKAQYDKAYRATQIAWYTYNRDYKEWRTQEDYNAHHQETREIPEKKNEANDSTSDNWQWDLICKCRLKPRQGAQEQSSTFQNTDPREQFQAPQDEGLKISKHSNLASTPAYHKPSFNTTSSSNTSPCNSTSVLTPALSTPSATTTSSKPPSSHTPSLGNPTEQEPSLASKKHMARDYARRKHRQRLHEVGGPGYEYRLQDEIVNLNWRHISNDYGETCPMCLTNSIAKRLGFWVCPEGGLKLCRTCYNAMSMFSA
ncbi:hypothetical protein CFE70_004127 [Pyrenophora teres f. teres 0-1]|uniref:J domain-containing protein n=1 Tax=Pyrenophora teres f. teres (strain 0-1) TaxID=861557 RepID=E3RJK5_PYRTT|nr:hypothetical protein PTT_08334 [Pyrenophora teres f. teres 0-1]